MTILGNICASPGKDEASTMPRFELFKMDVFGISSLTIRNVFLMHELFKDHKDGANILDLELVEHITFFLRNVL